MRRNVNSRRQAKRISFITKMARSYLTLRRCEKIGLHPSSVIPAEAGIQYFQAVNPAAGGTGPRFSPGRRRKAIFSQLLTGYSDNLV
jgi:hypothetical protein